MPKRADIIFDAERMKYPHTGIYHYCKQLGMALLAQQEDHVNKLGFYLPPSVTGVFGNDVYSIRQKALHRFYKPFVTDYKAWHVTNQVTNYFPWNSRKKVILTVHDLNFLYEKRVGKQQRYLADVQKKVSRADIVITISEFVKGEIKKNLKVDSNKVRVIYNGCNISPDTIPVKPAYKLDFPFIFTLGAITPKKNFAVLPAAIVNNDLHLVFAGVIQNKDYFNQIFDTAKKLGVEKKVHYIGPVFEPQKHWLMEHCTLFSFPSLAEGFGLPVIEAMRFGKAVLLSKATSLPEVGGKAAYYFDNFNGEHIQEVVANALANFDDAKRLEAIKWSYKFDWKRSAGEYWSIYDEMCR